MDVKHDWYEELPEQCPPSGALSQNGFECYRLCECAEPSDADFLSHRVLFPHKKFSVSDCQARSISVFNKPEDLDNVLKLPVHRHKAKVKITLNQEDGVVMKTGNNSHYSWWRSRRFDLSRAIEGDA